MKYLIKITEEPDNEPRSDDAPLPMPVEVLSLRLDNIDLSHVVRVLTSKRRATRRDAGKPRKPAEQ